MEVIYICQTKSLSAKTVMRSLSSQKANRNFIVKKVLKMNHKDVLPAVVQENSRETTGITTEGKKSIYKKTHLKVCLFMLR